jgi:hypothetical protein
MFTYFLLRKKILLVNQQKFSQDNKKTWLAGTLNFFRVSNKPYILKQESRAQIDWAIK